MLRPALRRVLWSARRRLTSREAVERSELRFWLEDWDPALRRGDLWGPDTLTLSGDTEVAPTYEGRRWQQARAEVARVLAEAGIEDGGFFDGRTVVDVGPGPVGFPDACPAALSVGVDPLAGAYAREGLLLESGAVYLSVPAERIPLLSGSVDVVVSRNSLDHVADPAGVIAEAWRLLRPGGHLILNVDVDHPATPSEPHEIRLHDLHRWLERYEIVGEREWKGGHGGSGDDPGHAVVILARKPGASGDGYFRKPS
jgi:SAM-dependent methyltransferase